MLNVDVNQIANLQKRLDTRNCVGKKHYIENNFDWTYLVVNLNFYYNWNKILKKSSRKINWRNSRTIFLKSYIWHPIKETDI